MPVNNVVSCAVARRLPAPERQRHETERHDRRRPEDRREVFRRAANRGMLAPGLPFVANEMIMVGDGHDRVARRVAASSSGAAGRSPRRISRRTSGRIGEVTGSV